jgi:tetratricopeptide (TPR) repeat protein
MGTIRALRIPLASLCMLLLLSRGLCAQVPENYAEAESLIKQGQFDQSITLLSRILTKNPKDVQAHNLLGIALTGKKQLSQANKEYRRALELKPDFVPSLKNLAINELSQNRVEASVRHFRAALRFAPQDPVIHAYLGKIAYSRQEYRTAADQLEVTGELRKDPIVAFQLIDSHLLLGEPEKVRALLNEINLKDFPPGLQFRLGLILAQHRLFQEAIPFFQNASGSNPGSYDVVFDLTVSYLETKQFSKAIEVLRRFIDTGHNTPELNNLLAEAYEDNGQTQESINALREAIRLDPEDENGYVQLAVLCTKYNSFDLGLDVIEAGLHYNPKSARLILERGVIYAMRNQFELAENDFQLAGQLSPQNTSSYAALGFSYMEEGDFPKAIAALRQRVQQKPTDATLQYLLGTALLRSGINPDQPAFADARGALEKSVRLNAKFPDAQVELAKLYLKENRTNDALEHLEQARALDPRNTSVYLQLAIAYRRKGQAELAAAMMKNLEALNQEEANRKRPQRTLRVVQGAPEPREATQ